MRPQGPQTRALLQYTILHGPTTNVGHGGSILKSCQDVASTDKTGLKLGLEIRVELENHV